MKSLIFLIALAFSVSGLAQDKKASPFNGKKETAKEKTAGAAPTAAPTAEPQSKAKPKAAAKKAADTKPTETYEDEEPVSPKAASMGDTIECKLGTDARKLVTKDKDGGCEVEYTKFGDTKVIGGAQYDKDVCVNVVAKVRATLESSGFACN